MRLHEAEGEGKVQEGKVSAVQAEEALPPLLLKPLCLKMGRWVVTLTNHFPLPANYKNKAVLFYTLLSHLLKVFPINLLYLPYAYVFSLTEGLAICCHHSLGSPSVLGVINQPFFCSQKGLFSTHTSQ